MSNSVLKKILFIIYIVFIFLFGLFNLLASQAISANLFLNKYRLFVFIFILLILGAYLIYSYFRYQKGKTNILVNAIYAIYKYNFLISQLVSRDFKSKYKRSVLGVVWSLLNPILTMSIQFLVFSTIFKSNVQNYPVYLLSGVICFNFFSECSNSCLLSISSNYHLINKVYIPKYIFPLSKTISSMVNIGLALIPLILVALITGQALNFQAFLGLYFIACLFVFSLGVGMLLASLMVFFRDMQFLWSVILQAWTYATPIFYVADIIPAKYSFILKLNPMYHFINNFRICLMNGVSPSIEAYLVSLFFALAAFFVGSFVFKKTQDKFTLYL